MLIRLHCEIELRKQKQKIDKWGKPDKVLIFFTYFVAI